jgi:hypothetical protein
MVEAMHLERHPVVLLGACHAAATSSFRWGPWNMPVSFLKAGASAVFGSLSELPDSEIGAFFAGVVRRMEAGGAPAVALRDERVEWLGRGQSWVGDVVVFD